MAHQPGYPQPQPTTSNMVAVSAAGLYPVGLPQMAQQGMVMQYATMTPTTMQPSYASTASLPLPPHLQQHQQQQQQQLMQPLQGMAQQRPQGAYAPAQGYAPPPPPQLRPLQGYMAQPQQPLGMMPGMQQMQQQQGWSAPGVVVGGGVQQQQRHTQQPYNG